MAALDVVEQGNENGRVYNIRSGANLGTSETVSEYVVATGDKATSLGSLNNSLTIIDKFQVVSGDGTSVASTEIILMGSVPIPKGSTIVDCTVSTVDGFISCNIGDTGLSNRFFSAENMAVAGTVARCDTAAAFGHTYTEDVLIAITALAIINDSVDKDLTVIVTITTA